MTEARAVPLADILSVTTPRLLSRRRMQGVCDLVDWMTYGPPTPDLIDLNAWSRLKLKTRISRQSLLRQHPQLADVQPDAGIDDADLYAWLVEQERVYGDELEVERAEVEMRAILDATVKAFVPVFESLRSSVQSMMTAVAPTIKAADQLCKQLARHAEEVQRAEAALPQHPDIAELDVRLDGYYGGTDA